MRDILFRVRSPSHESVFTVEHLKDEADEAMFLVAYAQTGYTPQMKLTKLRIDRLMNVLKRVRKELRQIEKRRAAPTRQDFQPKE